MQREEKLKLFNTVAEVIPHLHTSYRIPISKLIKSVLILGHEICEYNPSSIDMAYQTAGKCSYQTFLLQRLDDLLIQGYGESVIVRELISWRKKSMEVMACINQHIYKTCKGIVS
jgi:hypothetical protein